ncbi:MAG: NhaA family Na+:H+ antiporter [Planctomycetota bacterium]|jgi:NhaA family Na+:H+ antiporter
MTPSDPSQQNREKLGTYLLIAAAIAAVVVANSPLSQLYDGLLNVRFAVGLHEPDPAVSAGDLGAFKAILDKPLLLWINDGLMAVFFLMVGLELKREVLEGDLSDPRRIVLPLAATVGGIAVPVAIYLGINAGSEVRSAGFAIPAATDIAFAMGMLALLGRRVPPALRTFLLTLAVLDDVVSILIIAIFYTDLSSPISNWLALGALGGLIAMNRLGVTRYGPYLVVGSILWVCVLKTGVHATLAGVLLGLTIPMRARNSLGHAPLLHLEHVLRPWVAFVILPVFAFANAGVALPELSAEVFTHPVFLGVGLGLLLGKPIGVLGAAAIVLALGWAKLPKGVGFGHLVGASMLAAIGFTMSLFIGGLAFESEPRDFAVPIRLAVLAASLIATCIGLAILRWRSGQ